MKTEPTQSLISTRFAKAVLLLCCLASPLATLSARAQTPSVLTDHYYYLQSEPIVVSFTSGPGNPKDWVGIYPDGIVPGTQNSTAWFYVDGTQNGDKGLVDGSVTFPDGLTEAGDWVADLLLNDGYTKLAEAKFKVIDPYQTYIRLSKRSYAPGETISVAFTNGPGNAKDWIGVYPEDRQPGDGNSLVWSYVDGTQTGTSGNTEGVIAFSGGLTKSGRYIAYLLENDSYTVLANESFTVAPPASNTPRLLSISPAANATNVSAFVEFRAVITNGAVAHVASNSVQLKLDGAKVAHSYADQNGLITITYSTPSPLAAGSTHEYALTFQDDATSPNSYTNQALFTVINYINVVLPAPLYFENFDSTEEGQLPAGWTATSYSDVPDENFDLQDLNSKAYANWIVVGVNRFTNEFLSYDDHTPTTDYARVLSANRGYLENGKAVGPLASGRFAFGDSGYRSGNSQYLILFTPDFDLRGRTNVYVSYHSVYEQNQDAIGAVEYSVDQGKTWLPIVYMLETASVATNADGTIDALTTFNAEQTGTAYYTDPNTGEQKGGTYGAFIGAEVTANLAPFISIRIDDDPVGSKRVELFRLPQADSQQTVRFRFAYAGTDSWYFGVDNFGLYSIGAPTPVEPSLSIGRSGTSIVISWPADITGFTLESTDSLTAPSWSAVQGVSNNSIEVPIGVGVKFYRLRK